ncbi:MAG: NBR1-Ig-like domain-containing protein [Chloroflexota bacterium]
MSTSRVGKPIVLLIVVAILLACELPALPGYPTPGPTLDVENSIAGTFSAAQTQTAALLPPASPAAPTGTGIPSSTVTLEFTLSPTKTKVPPTGTPTPTLRYTLTPTEKPTITSTPLPIPPTPSRAATFSGDMATKMKTPTIDPDSSGKNWACKILSQYPPNGTIIQPGEEFTASWKLKNNGAETWLVNNVDYIYQKGSEIHVDNRYDIPKTVMYGDTVTIKVPMVAPKSRDAYRTIWALDSGKRIFCYMQIAIRVK